MGIRIHKSIGYGFAPVPSNETNINDDWYESIHESDFADYKKFLSDKAMCMDVLVNVFGEDPKLASFSYGNIEMFLKYIKDKAKREPWLYNFFNSHTEDPEKFIVFYPHNNIEDSIYGSWIRYDDTIDYYENAIYKKELGDVVVDLTKYGTQALHPYDTMMFLKPGRENKTKHADRIDIGFYNQLIGYWDSDIQPLSDEATIRHLKEDWGPSIPTSIKLFCFYTNAFKDPKKIYDMKPLLCQWWS